jgi:hypothetical protein
LNDMALVRIFSFINLTCLEDSDSFTCDSKEVTSFLGEGLWAQERIKTPRIKSKVIFFAIIFLPYEK